MRRALGVALGLVLFSTAPSSRAQSPLPTPQDAAAGTAAISGMVSDAVTGRPISGASISVVARGPGVEAGPLRRPSVLTDARGRFVLVDLSPAAQYQLIASHAGYRLGEYEGPRSAGAGGPAGAACRSISATASGCVTRTSGCGVPVRSVGGESAVPASIAIALADGETKVQDLRVGE